MALHFESCVCTLEVGRYIRLSKDRNCLLAAISKIENGSAIFKPLNDIQNPTDYYYEDCSHYFIVFIKRYCYNYYNYTYKYSALIKKIKPISGLLCP